MSRCATISALILAAGALLAGGCGRDESGSEAVRKASHNLHAVSGGGESRATNAHQQRLYSDASAAVQAASSAMTPAEAASGGLITARAHAGKSLVASNAAGEAEAEALRRIGRINLALTDYLALRAAAAAADQFDTQSAATNFDQLIAEKSRGIAERQTARGRIEERIRSLNAQAEAKFAEAKAFADRAGELRQQAVKLTAVEATPLIEQANLARRQEDTLRLEGMRLTAQAEQLAPELSEAQLFIEQLTTQRTTLESNKAQLLAMAESNRRAGAESRAKAGEIAAEIDSQLRELRALRGGEVKTQWDAMIGSLRSAASAAKRAQSDSPASAKVMIGQAQHALGNALWQQTLGMKAYASLLSSLAQAQPPLPNQGQYQAELNEVVGAAKTLATEAASAYDEAKAAYETAPTRSADDKARLQRLAEQIDRSARSAEAAAADLFAAVAVEAPPVEAPVAGTPARATPEVAGDGPEAAMAEFLRASREGRFADAAAYFFVTDPAAQQVLKASMEMAPAMKKLDDACKAKFGQTLSEAAQAMGAGPMGGPAAGLTDIDPATLRYEVRGDSADVLGGPQPLKMVRVGGKWLIDMSPFAGELAMAAPMVGQFGAMARAMEELASEVNAGRYQNMQMVMMAMMQKLGGPGGR